MKTLLEELNIQFKCYWHDIVCENGKECNDCSLQPPDDEKKNGMAEPLHRIWEIDCGGYPALLCPSCHELAVNEERCFFCGQRFLPDDESEILFAPKEIASRDCPRCKAKDSFKFTCDLNGNLKALCITCGYNYTK